MIVDAFWVRWEYAPDWAMWHAHDSDGQGVYFRDKPIPGDASWVVEPGNDATGEAYMFIFDRREVSGEDWRTSLRQREATS